MKYKVEATGMSEYPNVRVFDTETGKPLTAVQITEAMNQLETLKKELELAWWAQFYTVQSQGNPYHKLSGVGWIAKERKRQIQQELWTAEHDDGWAGGELVLAAIAYAWASTSLGKAKRVWPWLVQWFKPASPMRNLAKAGALIAAEIDRLQRKEGG